MVIRLKHKCKKRPDAFCFCCPSGLEPNDDCPMHGNPWPPRCVECGRFMKWPIQDFKELGKQYEKMVGAANLSG